MRVSEGSRTVDRWRSECAVSAAGGNADGAPEQRPAHGGDVAAARLLRHGLPHGESPISKCMRVRLGSWFLPEG